MTDRRQIQDWGGTWADIRANFRWNIPARFNIAEACCDSWARGDPERLALTHVAADGAVITWSYGQLKRASDRLAASFAARGVGQGDRVGVLLEQGPEVLIAHFAAQKRGAIVLPLFALFGPDALAFRLADSGAKVVVTDAAGLAKIDTIRADLPDLAEIYTTDAAPAPARNLWDEIDAARPIPPVDTGPDDPALLVYTSGTTGPPKGALHAHRVLLGHLPGIECQLERFPQPGDVGWTPADWAWIGGLMDLALPCLYHGVPLISHRMRKFDPDRAFDLIARHKVRTLFLPPTALKLMRRANVPDTVDIRAINSGGESLGPDLLDWGREVLGAPINEIYGQTECNLVVNTMASAMEVRPGMIGQPVPGHEVAIIDAEGREVARGETGEIAVKRPDPVMFLGYWKQPEKTAGKFVGDWLKTGDLGMMDADGYVGFVSRDDDVITSAGYRIGPSEIEHCLTAHPDVVMVAVVGVPDALRTEVVKAFVIAREGAAGDALREALIQRVRDKVSPHVAPRALEFVDSLPLTATGKIMRRSLREAERARHARFHDGFPPLTGLFLWRTYRQGRQMAVGIFDSGLGGLTVLDAVSQRLPEVAFVYYGDNAHAPYGVRDGDDIFELTKHAVERLWDEGCDLVILACNTASAAALRRLQEGGLPEGKRVLGVFVPLIEALTERQWGDNSPPREVAVKHVALFATPATVASRAFQRELAFRAIGVDVEAQACGGVVDAIEEGDQILAEALVRSHVEALRRKMPGPDAAILGCTHYPLMQQAFQDALGPDVAVFSQAGLVAASLADYLTRHPGMTGPGTRSKFLTTGDARRVSDQATRFLRRKITFEPA